MTKNKDDYYTLKNQETLGTLVSAVNYLQKQLDVNNIEIVAMRQTMQSLDKTLSKLASIEPKIDILEKETEKNVQDVLFIKNELELISTTRNQSIKNQKKIIWLIVGAIISIIVNILNFIFNILTKNIFHV